MEAWVWQTLLVERVACNAKNKLNNESNIIIIYVCGVLHITKQKLLC